MGQRAARREEAGRRGMEATIPLVARKGRASYLGERSVGHQDPGATSAVPAACGRGRDAGAGRLTTRHQPRVVRGSSRIDREVRADGVNPRQISTARGVMVGLVIVSHSARLAEGVAELGVRGGRRGSRPGRHGRVGFAGTAAGHRRHARAPCHRGGLLR